MANRASFVRAAVIVAALAGAPPALSQTPAPSAAPASVLDDIQVVDRPVQSFLPKYRPELFVGGGYSGTFTTSARQWPTFVLSPLEGLLFRPGRFDVGVYSELRLGRPDENFGRLEVGFGLEAMWRFIETSASDWAAVLRGGYLIDTTNPGDALLRPGIGAQVSLVRSLALQITYDQLYSPSRDFSTGHGLLHGLSVTIKIGICPSGDFCHQMPESAAQKLDRSAVTCQKAAATCQAAQSSTPGTGAALCDAALRAMDTTHHPADWDDPVGAFLRALRAESTTGVVAVVGASLSTLESEHAASMQGLDDYAARKRSLDSSKMLSKQYGYLVTPVMVRDWLGCAANGQAIPCATDAVCERDTGVTP